MKRLILLRHAKTARGSDGGGDFARALTERGQSDAALMGQVLSGAGLIPDRVLVSAARRAVQTWEGAAPWLPDAHVEIRKDLYNASTGQLRAAAESSDGKTVMIVAHNPSIQALAIEFGEACTLIAADVRTRLADGMPSGAAAAFEFDDGRTGCLGLYLPADHGGGRRSDAEDE